MEQSLRIIDIMSLSLTKDKLTLDEELEITINSDLNLPQKEAEIKRLLKEIVLADDIILKWTEYTSQFTEKIEE